MSLEPCPSSPNCISTQADPDDSQHYMEPVTVSASATDVLNAVEEVLGEESGAEVTLRTDHRVDAVFTTRICRFKDDVTFLVEGDRLHLRSASRSGHSDLGKNRKRLDSLVPKITSRLG